MDRQHRRRECPARARNYYEWVDPKGDQFGVRRIKEIIRLAREKPPRELISALYQAVTEFSEGTHQQDDLTAVVVKRV